MTYQVPSWSIWAGYALGFAMGATAGARMRFYREFLSRRRSKDPRQPGPYSSHARGLQPPPPLVGHARWFINNPAQIAECGGPCSAGPSHCDCGALWVDVPLPPELDRRFGVPFDEGRVQRGNGNGSGGPTTPKPDVIPKPQPLHGRVTDGWGRTVGFIPRPQGGTPNPPPEAP